MTFDISNYKTGMSYVPTPGADPEMFVRNGKGKIIPAFKFLPDKKMPASCEKLADNGMGRADKIYYDGFQGEFSTSSPSCLGWFSDGIAYGLYSLVKAARKLDVNARLTIESTPFFSVSTMEDATDEQVAFGCEPSKNAYGLIGKEILNPRKLRYRFAGGHIHMGDPYRPQGGLIGQYTPPVMATFAKKWNSNKEESYIKMVKGLDAILGVYMVGVAASFDKKKRRQYYGMAGEYRTPAHGLEYRVLSNFWLTAPFMCQLVHGMTREIWKVVCSDTIKWWVAEERETVETINNCDVAHARKILARNEAMLRHIIMCGSHNFGNKQVGDLGMVLAMQGAEAVLKNPDDVNDNWCIGPNDASGNPQTRWLQHTGCTIGDVIKTTMRFYEGGQKPLCNLYPTPFQK